MSVSGLDRKQRHRARMTLVQGANLLLRHAQELHYTQDANARWEGIHNKLDYRKGQGHLPKHGDCSSTVTYLLWVPLHLMFGLGDIVNGDRWLGGYTGTEAQNGRQVHHLKNVLIGDIVLYGAGPRFEHVAIVIDFDHDGTPLVFSHGSESGPYKARYDYRPVGQIRRMI